MLHPQLAADTHLIGDLKLSRVLLMNNANFPWVILVPRVEGVVEWFDLTPETQQQLHTEVMQVAAKLKAHTRADKINIAALGNQVSQLHVHIIARSKADAAWPNPVWNCGVAATAYEDTHRLCEDYKNVIL